MRQALRSGTLMPLLWALGTFVVAGFGGLGATAFLGGGGLGTWNDGFLPSAVLGVALEGVERGSIGAPLIGSLSFGGTVKGVRGLFTGGPPDLRERCLTAIFTVGKGGGTSATGVGGR